MSLWRSVRGEMAGAWRSICYDLGRRPASPSSPDVTSTGMETFPGSLVDLPVAPVAQDARPPRRFVGVAAFCALSLCGAAGSYLVATTAFADRMRDPVPVAAPPAAPSRPPAAETGDDGMGAVPPATRQPRAGAPAPAVPAPGAGTVAAPVTGSAAGATARPVVPAAGAPRKPAPPAAARPTSAAGSGIPEVTTSPDCGCETPPVPTPTAPSPTPSVPDSGSPSASPSADPSVSATTDAGPSTDASDRRHRRHRH